MVWNTSVNEKRICHFVIFHWHQTVTRLQANHFDKLQQNRRSNIHTTSELVWLVGGMNINVGNALLPIENTACSCNPNFHECISQMDVTPSFPSTS